MSIAELTSYMTLLTTAVNTLQRDLKTSSTLDKQHAIHVLAETQVGLMKIATTITECLAEQYDVLVDDGPKWKIVQTKKQSSQQGKSKLNKSTQKNKPKQPPAVVLTQIHITPSLSIPACIINTFDEATECGIVYYVKPCEHFAITIAGHLFHGNVGVVFIDEHNPTKIKDCKYALSCYKPKECGYYHDPRVHTSSTDRRNYILSNYMLSSHKDAMPTQHTLEGVRKRGLGSIDQLDADVLNTTHHERLRQYDYTMHNILLSLLFTSRS